ncbi:hypothetical protein [Arthrobacter glacialis]|uniref:hypothetical protein n=1 Tax=Arthrobacter glacialis TaxID=1664 RepID=UPI000CD4439C|nr:hypothetical protein [Arthrobacter glacialis]POH58264.1 hypothetical protein CVS28_12540 [Arthrobacter glacialis]
MSEYGADLDVWYSAGRWVALIELIDMLPDACRLNEAIVNDPEMAELLASQPDPVEPWSPRVSDNTLTNVILARIADGIASSQQTQVAVAGGKPAKVAPFPTPRTAITRLREREDLELFHDMQARFGF